MTANGKKLMVLGATWEQAPLIRTAKEMGCTVLATDPNPEADGLKLADDGARLDPRDLPRALDLARAFAPDGITADECDYSHYAAVYLSAQLGLPHDGLEAAQFTTNKLWMRERCRAAHILQPRFFACPTLKEAQEAAKVIGWPVIVKPVDNRGAFGVNVARDEAALERAFLDALMNAHSRLVLVEAFVEGTHITVDGCVDQAGRHHNLAIATKKVTPGDKPIIVEVAYPAELDGELTAHVLETNTAVVDALAIRGGLTHSEYIVDSRGRCFLVETANRGGGVLTSAVIVPAVSGVDVSRLLVSNALGLPFAVAPRPDGGLVVLTFFVFKPGRLKAVNGVAAATTLPGVLHLRLLVRPGQELVPPRSGAGRHGFAILKAADRAGLDRVYGAMLDALKVEYA
jgi:biotin carboxylase